jgi:hypothetical protein
MTDEIFFEGVRYIPASVAASEADLTRDYIARLCKENSIVGRRVGKKWYVNFESLKSFLVAQENARNKRRRNLTRERVKEYWNRNGKQSSILEAALTIPLPKMDVEVMHAPVVSPIAVDSLSKIRISELQQKERSLESLAKEKSEGVPEVKVADHVKSIHQQMAAALAKKSAGVFGHTAHFATAPAGIAHAAFHSAHVPAHAITPATEVLHKIAALTLALVLTFGSYASLNTDFAFFAKDSIRREISSVRSALSSLTNGD